MLFPNRLRTLVLLLLAALIIGTLSAIIYVRRVNQTYLQNGLEAVLNASHQAIQIWHKNELQLVESWARNRDLVRLSSQLLSATKSNAPPEQKIYADQISQRFKFLLESNRGRGYQIIAPDKTIIASDLPSLVGRSSVLMNQPDIAKKTRLGLPVMSHIFMSQTALPDNRNETAIATPTQFSVAPIVDSQQKVIALLALRIDLNKDFAPLLAHSRFGRSGETYIFDQAGQMLSESRFNQQLIDIGLLYKGQGSRLNISLRDPGRNLTREHKKSIELADVPLTVMAREATAKKSGFNLSGYRDYRGIEVVGAWLWDEKLNMGLATEVDKEEALASYKSYLLALLALSVTSTGILIFLFRIYKSNQISQQQLYREKSSILNNTSAFIYIKNIDNRVIFANREARDIFKIENELFGEQIQKAIPTANYPKHSELIPPKNREVIDFDDETVLHGEKSLSYEANLIIKNEKRTFLLTKFPLRNERDVIYAIGISGIDISHRLETERKLLEKERFLANLMANLPGAVYRCTIQKNDWQLTYISHGSIELLGQSNLKIIRSEGHIFDDLVHPEDRERVRELARAALSSSLPYQLEFRLNSTRQKKWLWARGRIFESDGITVTEGFLSDITERKTVEQELSAHRRQLTTAIADRTKELDTERERLNNIIRSAADGIISFNNKFAINLYSPAAKKLLGHSKSKTIGDNFLKLFTEESAEILKQEITKLDAMQPTKMAQELDAIHESGKIIRIEASLSRNAVHGITNYTLIMRDISIRQEEQRALTLAKSNAEQASKTKSQFLANISHEIRTPLNAITGMIQLALRTPLSSKQQRYLKTIEYSSHTLLGVINDVLDFSKMEAGKLIIERIPFNLESSLESISQMTSFKAQESGVDFLLDIDQKVPAHLLGDPLRLSQILTNLCSNATKFTERGNITLGVKFVDQKDNRVTLEFFVSDTGIGLSETQKNQLFVAFSQADPSVTRKYGGTGLGLSICRELVRLMHGDIQIESKEGEGSRFSFQLEFEIDTQQELQRQNNSLRKKLHILLIEDNQTSANLLTTALMHMQHTVTHCSSAEHSLQCLNTDTTFDVILVDWQLPGMQSGALISQIRSIHKSDMSPVLVMMTATEESEDSTAAMDAGADSLLTKPISNSTLLDTLEHLTIGAQPISALMQTMATPIVVPRHLQGAKLLIAEDNQINQEIATEIFQAAGFNVVVANDGQEAIRLFELIRFDAILMDIQMPVMDGETATKAIRASVHGKQIPIIAMTANALKEDEQRCLSMGMNAYLTKPIDIERAITTIIDELTRTGFHQQHITIARQNERPMSSTTEHNRFNNLPGIEAQRGLQNCAGNAELYLRLLIDFLQQYKDGLMTLAQLLDQKDYVAAQQHIHSLKGVAGNLGAMTVYQTCCMFEENLRSTQPDPALATAQHFSLQKAMQQLQKNISALSSEPNQ